MLQLFPALAVVVALVLGYHVCVVRLVLDPRSPLRRTRRRLREAGLARRESADLDREHASLIDEHRRTP